MGSASTTLKRAHASSVESHRELAHMRKVLIGGLSLALALACAKGEQSKAAAVTDSTARNLTLAPSETSAARHDAPVPQPTPAVRPPVARPKIGRASCRERVWISEVVVSL